MWDLRERVICRQWGGMDKIIMMIFTHVITVSNNNALPIPSLQSPLTFTQTCNTMKSFVTQNAYYTHIKSTSYKSAEECIQIILALKFRLFSNLSHHHVFSWFNPTFLFGERGSHTKYMVHSHLKWAIIACIKNGICKSALSKNPNDCNLCMMILHYSCFNKLNHNVKQLTKVEIF